MKTLRVSKSGDLASKLFPERYKGRTRPQPFHYAFLFAKQKLVSIGQNVMDKESAKALAFALRYNLATQRKYPFIHAEIDSISRVWGKQYIDNNFTMVSLRISKGLVLRNAKPCKNCKSVLDSLGVSVYYSDGSGKICVL